MKRILLATAAILSSTAAFGAQVGDGCYALAKPGENYGFLCIRGSAEEGIGGANAILAAGLNITDLKLCAKTSRIVSARSSKTFVVETEYGSLPFVFRGDAMKGTLSFADASLSYNRIQMSPQELKIIFSNRACPK